LEKFADKMDGAIIKLIIYFFGKNIKKGSAGAGQFNDEF
jgi:hypothetical protein